MHPLLDNPVFISLWGKDKHLGSGSLHVKYFDKEVSPFAGFDHGYKKGFEELYELLPAGSNILYATPFSFERPGYWQVLHEIKGLQFVHNKTVTVSPAKIPITPLDASHVPAMVSLAERTKPGPFGKRTIDFGHYYGVMDKDKLVSMTGQRLHVGNYTEISAVCTDPGHLGKGYAYALMQHQVNLILSHDQIPFLHVREDNKRAIEIYKRTGFTVSRHMNFYFMKKPEERLKGS